MSRDMGLLGVHKSKMRKGESAKRFRDGMRRLNSAATTPRTPPRLPPQPAFDGQPRLRAVCMARQRTASNRNQEISRPRPQSSKQPPSFPSPAGSDSTVALQRPPHQPHARPNRPRGGRKGERKFRGLGRQKRRKNHTTRSTGSTTCSPSLLPCHHLSVHRPGPTAVDEKADTPSLRCPTHAPM